MSSAILHDLSYRRAAEGDLENIIQLLIEDDLGKTRESASSKNCYQKAFNKIAGDSNQFLMVVEHQGKIIATCHLTVLYSLTFIGSARLQIEAVRVSGNMRGHSIGKWMINAAIDYGKKHDVKIIQLMTNNTRKDAIRFYESIGFKATHEGMKICL
jgi:N-acetylglutamate synthase-like GNAT family acetyltransferase